VIAFPKGENGPGYPRDTQGAQDRGGGERDGALLVRLAAPPVEGAANDALIEVPLRRAPPPRRDIRIVSGERSRRKRVAIAG
jgi:uncharacterized protein YggU (UPF0235/DUF167 family)